MDEPIVIAVLAGTTRAQRESINAAKYVAAYGQQLENVDIIFVDPLELTFHGDGNDPEGKDPRYSEITKRADAFFIVTPEYNHSFPGSLKRMLDSELGNYVHKPVAFAGVSNGNWGGVRAVEALVNTVREMGLMASFADVYFPFVQDLFDETGQPDTDHKAQIDSSLDKAYKELVWLAHTLKVGRENRH